MTRIIAMTSGKGRVGKTHLDVDLGVNLGVNLGVDLAMHCARAGLRVGLFDADSDLTNANPLHYDLMMFDISSGAAGNVLAFAVAASELLLVITPEPTAFTDAYALVKRLQRQHYTGRIQVVVNQAHSERQAVHTFEKFREVVRVYQGLELPLLGWIPLNERVGAEQVGEAARAIAELATRLIGLPPQPAVTQAPVIAHSNKSAESVESVRGRRAGETGVPARFVRNAQRATPIDALQLRRVVGRMLVKAIPDSNPGLNSGVDVARAEPVHIAVDQVQLDAGNEFSLRAGRYTRISLHCQHIQSPDNFIEEIFATCDISGCKVRHLGTHMRYWLTDGRDGCILLDGDDYNRNCVRVYMAAGGNALMTFESEEPESIPSLRRIAPAGGVAVTPEKLLEKFPHQSLFRETAEGERVEMFRLLRRDQAPLLCAFQRADGETAAGTLRERSP